MNLLCDTGNQTGVSGSEVPSLGIHFNALSHCTGLNEILFLGLVLLLYGCAAGWNYDWNALTTLRNKVISFFQEHLLNTIATLFLVLLRNWMFHLFLCSSSSSWWQSRYLP